MVREVSSFLFLSSLDLADDGNMHRLFYLGSLDS